jgi:hypothetical protein
MKVFRCQRKKNGMILFEWTDAVGDINYSHPSIIRNSSEIEVIEADTISDIRKDKLKRLRELRDAVKAETFAEVFEDFLLDETPVYPKSSVRKYKRDLKNVLDPYKNWKDDPEAAARLDALVVEDFVWPVIQ